MKSSRIRVCVAGVTGWVGRTLVPAIAAAPDLELASAVSRSSAGRRLSDVLKGGTPGVEIRGSVAQALATPCDVLIDYTSPEAVRGNVLEAVRRGVAAVIGTSGLTEEDLAAIDGAAREKKVGVLAAGNFALTAVLLQRFAEIAAKHVPQWEIVEYHKADKPDAPGSTARELAARLAAVRAPAVGHPIGETQGHPGARGQTLSGTQIHSVRLPGFVSSIEILFGMPDERLTIRHDSGSGAAPYVSGTLLAVRKVGSFTGLRRGLDRVLEL
jgi:4-hydroxy-tetrahydrodipicolinate reductase